MALPPDRQRLVAAMLRAIAHHAVGDRPGRVEPCAANDDRNVRNFLWNRASRRKRLLQVA